MHKDGENIRELVFTLELVLMPMEKNKNKGWMYGGRRESVKWSIPSLRLAEVLQKNKSECQNVVEWMREIYSRSG